MNKKYLYMCKIGSNFGCNYIPRLDSLASQILELFLLKIFNKHEYMIIMYYQILSEQFRGKGLGN